MSLASELAAKIEKERAQQLQGMLSYLKNIGAEATVVDENRTDSYGRSFTEAVIHLKGQTVDKIRLITAGYSGYDECRTLSRFSYEVILDKPLSGEPSKAFTARLEPIKDNKKLGLFGGKVTGVTWIGHDVAIRLNQDTDLSRLILASIEGGADTKYEIQQRSPSLVEIMGPAFLEPPPLVRLETLATSEGQEKFNRLFGFEIYSRIARHIRDAVSQPIN